MQGFWISTPSTFWTTLFRSPQFELSLTYNGQVLCYWSIVQFLDFKVHWKCPGYHKMLISISGCYPLGCQQQTAVSSVMGNQIILLTPEEQCNLYLRTIGLQLRKVISIRNVFHLGVVYVHFLKILYHAMIWVSVISCQ